MCASAGPLAELTWDIRSPAKETDHRHLSVSYGMSSKRLRTA
jgi:hypothetical protein